MPEEHDQSDIAAFYTAYFSDGSGGVHPRTLAPIAAHIPPSYSIDILDAGCGDAAVARLLARSGYLSVAACDILDQDVGDGVDYVRANLEALPYPSERFDFVACLSAVYYADPPEVALSELARVTRPGGTLVLTFPTRFSVPTIWRLWMRDVVRSPSMRHLSGVQFLSIRRYEMALRHLGFEVIERDGWGRILPIGGNFRWRRQGLLFRLADFGLADGRSSRLLRWLRSRFAYHSTLVAAKS